jgi:hypothetical protein
VTALYFHNSRAVRYSSEQEKGIELGEVSALQFCNGTEMHYTSTTRVGHCIVVLNRRRALQWEMSVHYSSVREEKLFIYRYLYIQRKDSALYFYNRRRTSPYNSEQEKGIAQGKACALLLCKRNEMNYNPAIGKGLSIIGM